MPPRVRFLKVVAVIVAVAPEYLIVDVPTVNEPVTVSGVPVPVNSKVFAPGVNVVLAPIFSDVALTFEDSERLVDAVESTIGPKSCEVPLLSVIDCAPPELNVTFPAPLVTVAPDVTTKLPLIVIVEAGMV